MGLLRRRLGIFLFVRTVGEWGLNFRHRGRIMEEPVGYNFLVDILRIIFGECKLARKVYMRFMVNSEVCFDLTSIVLSYF